MSDALNDLTQLDITPDYIRRRVDDWVQRVSELCDLLERWLPEGWTATRTFTVPMHEELMQKFGVPPRGLPVLDLIHTDGKRAIVKPRGLWIIGANGQLDLRGSTGAYIVIDKASSFSPPSWHVAALTDRTKLVKLTQTKFRQII